MTEEYGGFNLVSSPEKFLLFSNNHLSQAEMIHMNYYSARGCILDYLRHRKVKKIYIPNYFCHIVTEYLMTNDIEVKMYQVDFNLDYDEFMPVERNAIMLLVNYFGLYESKIKRICDKNPENYLVDNTHSLLSISNNSPEVFSYRKHLQVPFGASIFIEGKNWCTQDKIIFNDLDYSFLYSKSKNDVYERYKRFDYVELNNDTNCDIRVTKNYISQVTAARMNIIDELRKLTPTLNERLEYSKGGLFCRIEVGPEVASLRQAALRNNIYLANLWANIPSLSSALEKELETHLILPLDPFTSPKGLDNFLTFAENHL